MEFSSVQIIMVCYVYCQLSVRENPLSATPGTSEVSPCNLLNTSNVSLIDRHPKDFICFEFQIKSFDASVLRKATI